ncbi:MAG TPA: multicopper oxidase domain-containing protein, partial [Terriglobia bacterium]|nr:multicopper oxidase domain-containing protein [Terriglobia bacterium]
MSKNRRDFFRKALAGAGLLTGTKAFSTGPTQAAQHEHMQHDDTHLNMGQRTPAQKPSSNGAFLAVQTPDIPDLPWSMDNGVKVFHLIAEPVKRQIHPMKTLDLWGYNGTSPGPTIQIMQGDRVRFIVDNHLPEPTSMHWHGFEIPAAMDGTPGIDQVPIPPGGRFI